ncbi:uncharacterized protein LOC111592706 [Drosophila hydei]|uniref:Uncharacterized protein LOC111592706 n=1 Tax=Drosophila hydei TaxID=7224 RepID=A0A6J1LC66_DROHY|nr:uncharacterized protein LOC111592706 [Drosophila hydei]
MKLAFLSIVCCCLFALAFGHDIAGTKAPFVRSRYSLRWRKTTTAMPETTTGRVVELVTSTERPRVGTSTTSPDYDYYGNGEADNMVHK